MSRAEQFLYIGGWAGLATTFTGLWEIAAGREGLGSVEMIVGAILMLVCMTTTKRINADRAEERAQRIRSVQGVGGDGI